MADAVLTINAGSSSIKFSLVEIDSGELRTIAHGALENIDSSPRLVIRSKRGGPGGRESAWNAASSSSPDFVNAVIAWAEAHLGDDILLGVGHRVVHGGVQFREPLRVTPLILDALEELVPLAPLHQPHNLDPIRVIAATHPSLPQVACFDTAFHHGLPAVAARFALPRDYETAGIRRYGFHGLSYEYVSRRLRETVPRLWSGRVIAAHLGSGASLCAMHGGHSIDTTMGFTALDGLVMGTRCGNIDPGVILYLERERGLSPKQVEDLLYNHSGLLGVSGGLSNDMKVLLESEDAHAREAVELFVFRIAREAGGLVSSLGGLDGLIFTAGIGENAAAIRTAVCTRLAWLGIVLDETANVRGDSLISTPASRVSVRIIPTDEEATIARHTFEAVNGKSVT